MKICWYSFWMVSVSKQSRISMRLVAVAINYARSRLLNSSISLELVSMIFKDLIFVHLSSHTVHAVWAVARAKSVEWSIWFSDVNIWRRFLELGTVCWASGGFLLDDNSLILNEYSAKIKMQTWYYTSDLPFLALIGSTNWWPDSILFQGLFQGQSPELIRLCGLGHEVTAQLLKFKRACLVSSKRANGFLVLFVSSVCTVMWCLLWFGRCPVSIWWMQRVPLCLSTRKFPRSFSKDCQPDWQSVKGGCWFFRYWARSKSTWHR